MFDAELVMFFSVLVGKQLLTLTLKEVSYDEAPKPPGDMLPPIVWRVNLWAGVILHIAPLNTGKVCMFQINKIRLDALEYSDGTMLPSRALNTLFLFFFYYMSGKMHILVQQQLVD